jgi:hypothetical protein
MEGILAIEIQMLLLPGLSPVTCMTLVRVIPLLADTH